MRMVAYGAMMACVMGSFVGCMSDETPTAGGNVAPIGESRPAAVFMPAHRIESDSRELRPLVILLHGFTSDGASHDEYFRLSQLVDELDYVLVVPDGEQNLAGIRYWNATANCCDFEERETDDVTYISELIDEAVERYPVDPERVYLFGHSNGGFLAHSVACQHADQITGVISVSASSYTESSSCVPSSPVSVLHAHGTEDEVIWFGGGFLVDDEYPSARELVRRWARYDGCPRDSVTREHEHPMLNALGAHVHRRTWTGCDEGASVEMWSLKGEGHRPSFLGTRFSEMALEHMFGASHELVEPVERREAVQERDMEQLMESYRMSSSPR